MPRPRCRPPSRLSRLSPAPAGGAGRGGQAPAALSAPPLLPPDRPPLPSPASPTRSLRTPRMGTRDRQPEAWATEAKEFLRKRCIGRQVGRPVRALGRLGRHSSVRTTAMLGESSSIAFLKARSRAEGARSEAHPLAPPPRTHPTTNHRTRFIRPQWLCSSHSFSRCSA
jgi:hypothetical protein